jgi:hypothetical protein
MKHIARSLTLLAGLSLAAVLPARAQFIELVTEAPVTFQVVLTTPSSTASATERRNTTTITRLAQAQIITDLRAAGVINDTTNDGWTLLAVRYPAPDLYFVNAAFQLFAVKGEQRIPVPQSKFVSIARNSVEKYRERHLGQYVLSSSGTVTNHVRYAYLPSVTVGGTTFDITNSESDGFASVNFTSRDSLGEHEIFFYAINSLRATTRGSFESNNGQGLIALTVSVGTPKLVDAALYQVVE